MYLHKWFADLLLRSSVVIQAIFRNKVVFDLILAEDEHNGGKNHFFREPHLHVQHEETVSAPSQQNQTIKAEWFHR